MTELVLFCGGPADYQGGVPKPMQVVNGDQTLLELYLSCPFALDFDRITLLCETSQVDMFRIAIEEFNTTVEFLISESADNSSTFEKLSAFVASRTESEQQVVFSYPDVFYFDSVPCDGDFDYSSEVSISVRAFTSRFPRLVLEPFANRARSISMHRSHVPANPVHLFAGHLVARINVLASLIEDIVDISIMPSVSLEFDFFQELISRGIVNTIGLESAWVQADGPRDLKQIVSLLNAPASR